MDLISFCLGLFSDKCPEIPTKSIFIIESFTNNSLNLLPNKLLTLRNSFFTYNLLNHKKASFDFNFKFVDFLFNPFLIITYFYHTFFKLQYYTFFESFYTLYVLFYIMCSITLEKHFTDILFELSQILICYLSYLARMCSFYFSFKLL